MNEQQNSEKSPRIVIISPVEEKGEHDISEDDDIEAGERLTRSDPEASGRLSVLSSGSVGGRSLISRISGLSLDSRIYRHENMFLVTVFVITGTVFVLVGIFIAKTFLCEVCDQKKDTFANVTTVEDLDEYQYYRLEDKL